jgi:cell division septation protein DedD
VIASRILSALCFLLLAGCGSAEKAQQEEQPPGNPAAVLPEPAPAQQPPRFESQTDTVTATRESEQEAAIDSGMANPEVRFMIQIGAFQDPQNASVAQNLARERYHLPVLNDYTAHIGLYQIRIGFFETRETAHEFLVRMQTGYPQDYKDSWVVQLKR